jgi:hypothetical protein
VERTKEVLEALGDDFVAVQLDMFLALAGSEPTFKPHVQPS